MVSERLSLFNVLNPWWQTEEVPSSWMGLPREKYLGEMLKWINDDFIQVVSGIRRCGKTTLIHQVINKLLKDKQFEPMDVLFVNCDDVKVRGEFTYLVDLASLFNAQGQNKKLIVLDEVQYYEKWEQQCKNLYDTFKGRVKFIISGSSATLKTSKDLHFLTGRMMPCEVTPFSFAEFLRAKKITLPSITGNFETEYKKLAMLGLDSFLQEYLEFGGLPAIVLTTVDKKNQIAKEYFDEVIYKDIVKLWEIKDVKNLEKVALFLMQNVGQRFSYRKIAEAVEENKNTTQNYLHYLEESYLVQLIDYYAKSTSQQFRKEKKITIIDSIFHTSRFGLTNVGSSAENSVYSHLSRKELRIFYWKNKYEVDFVVEAPNGRSTPIEVKYQNKIDSSDFKGLVSFFRHFPEVSQGFLVSKNEFRIEKTSEGKTITIMPLWLFLLQ